jgi:UDP-N-acetylglucosamine 2-epimerase (non-hydrolysing)
LGTRKSIMVIFGTRPEIIKLAPVIHELESHADVFRTINVSSGQHNGLLQPFVGQFGVRVDYDLKVMEHGQAPTGICSRVLRRLEPVLGREKPDLLLVQGDTTTAMAGALAGFYQRIPVGHVEAGLRSGNVYSPHPEEMNRQLTTRLASYHFAPTLRNVSALVAEGVDRKNIFVTGNTIVDAVQLVLERTSITPDLDAVIQKTKGLKRIILTTHRRESFGEVLEGNLRAIRNFVNWHQDVAVIFPVHPNPAVVGPVNSILSGHPRIHLLQPLGYGDFIALLSNAWLIVSDSGGVQEEAPTLGKPLLIMRENTERPEAVEAGVARLVGRSPQGLRTMLEHVYTDDTWHRQVQSIDNPFGRGDSGKQIVQCVADSFGVSLTHPHRAA